MTPSIVAYICLAAVMPKRCFQLGQLVVFGRVKHYEHRPCAGLAAVFSKRKFFGESALAAGGDGYAELKFVR
ncbi:MAG: hypothetical protein AD742_10110 [Methylibium sp. NZG]|nr:MAG: hypothetical protein AD742_10110 [Methylibium sp. NZG]